MTGKEANLRLRFGCKVRRHEWPASAFIRSDHFHSYTSRTKKWKFEKVALYVHGPIDWVEDSEGAAALISIGWFTNDWEVIE